MLKLLRISNYALIDFLEINLEEGLTIITGETGAGKSIIMGALSLLLGQRFDAKIIRNNEKKSVIEACFRVTGYNLENIFASNDIDDLGEECILRREILPNGRTRAFVNDTPVTLVTLEAIALSLVDIHSQHSNALLLKPEYRLQILDSLADNEHLRKEYKLIYSEYCNVRKHLQEEKERIEKNRDNEEYFKFQLSQIKPLKLKDGEQENLEQSYKVLSNVAEIKEKIYLATEWIGNGTSSVLTKLQKTLTSLESIREMFDASGQIIERIEPILIELQDIYDTLNGEVENLTDSPAELAEIETRLNMIYALQQKHHVGTVAELIEIQKDLEKSLSEIQNSDKELSGLEAKLKDLEKSLSETADNLSKSRMEAASVFEKELIEVAVPLGLKNLQFKVDRKKIEYNSLGNDSVTFSVGFNKNQQLMPVEKTASGGELSRLMLSIKYIIAKSMQLPSIIFDEIDTGVSGEIANKIGEMMKKISKQIQVITITHLPQVAALGDCHFKVYKKDNDNTTITNIKQLDDNDRILEIAGMLSGATINDAAIENAKSFVKIIKAMLQSNEYIFGIRAVIEAIASGKEIDRILIKKDLSGELSAELFQIIKEYKVLTQRVPVEKLNRITRKNHQGVIAIFSPVSYENIDNLVPTLYESGKTPFIVVLDGITDVRNFGAIARTCECAGVNAIVIPERGSVSINADAVKTSAGALLHIPVARVRNLNETIKQLKNSGMSIVGVTEKGSSDYTKANLQLPTALIMGAEDTGISAENLRECDFFAAIPMYGKINSLNVSVAAGIMIYEVIRQRNSDIL